MALGHRRAAVAGVAGKLGAAHAAIAVDRLGCSPRISLELYPMEEMNTSEQEPIGLRRFFLTKRQLRVGFFIWVGVFAFVFGYVLWIFHTLAPEKSWLELAALIWRATTLVRHEDPIWWRYSAWLAIGLQLLVIVFLLKYERLVIDRVGIHYQTPLPHWLRRFAPGWTLPWEKIKSAALSGHGRLNSRDMRLILSPIKGAKIRSVKILMWADPAAADQPVFAPIKDWQFNWTQGASNKRNYERIRNRALASPLISALKHHNIDVIIDEIFGNFGFALEKNRHSLTAICLLLVFLAYFLVEFFIGNEQYVERPELWPFGLAAIVVAIAVTVWLFIGKIPFDENMAIGSLLGVAIGAPMYPGLLRINQLSDREGLTIYQYQLVRKANFMPLSAGLPDLSFSYDEYWQQFKPGSRHTFELRKGGLGFYQVNMATIHKDIKAYYRGPRAKYKP